VSKKYHIFIKQSYLTINKQKFFRISVLWEIIDLAGLNTNLISLFLLFIVIIGIILFIYYIKYSRDKFTQKYGAPDYKTALKVSEGLFPSYSIYLEAQKRQAENYHQYNVTEKYKVNSYPLAYKIVSGKFPTFEAYKIAANEGYFYYPDWIDKEQLKKALVSLIQRAESVHRDDFMTVMGFSNSQQFMDWVMKLPDYSPFILKGDVITFHKSRSQSFEELVNDTLCYAHNPQYQGQSQIGEEPQLKPIYLADLSEDQRQILEDLRTRKAIPLLQMLEVFQVKEIELVPTVQSYLPEGELITRIEDLYRMVKPTHFCQLCQKPTDEIPYFQCKLCSRYICNDHFIEMNQLGYPSCPECSGDLVALPVKCKGCGITYLDWSIMKNHVKCQFCNYQLEYPEISLSQSRSVPREQIDESPKKLPSQAEGKFCIKCGAMLNAEKVCPKCKDQ
jgi:hypothetical protein